MLIREVMTTNVVTVSSNTTVYEARKIMQAHNFKRLPVVDKGKLVGIVSLNRLESISPPKGVSASIWEINVLLAKTTVGEVMAKNLVTVSPDTTVEEGLAIAQGNKIGLLLVVEDGALVGVATTNDFFYKIVNPILGLGKPGTRLFVSGAGEGQELEDVIATVNHHQVKIVTLFPITRDDGKKNDLIIHLATEDSSQINRITSDLKDKGYIATIRKR
jgi:acetoin utilization protein AcuB